MKEQPVKTYPTLGCCGLDCGLCPRYHTVSGSGCPGCAGRGFFEMNPSCGHVTCCVKKKRLEVCTQCEEFPCPRLAGWLDKRGLKEYVLTSRKIKPNLDFIRQYGLELLLEQQQNRIELLKKMLRVFNDGRSKSFYCLAATLLPVADLEAALNIAERKVKTDKVKADDLKTKSRILRDLLSDKAAKEGVELKLKK